MTLGVDDREEDSPVIGEGRAYPRGKEESPQEVDDHPPAENDC